MATIFMSYSRQTETVAKTVAAHIGVLDHKVRFDQELSGGQAWWDRILSMIRECDVFVVVLDPEVLRSVPCERERNYARALGKPVVPVLVSAEVDINRLPLELSQIQFIDYRKQDADAALRLARALGSIPPAGALPNPLPPPPGVPISYLAILRERVFSDSNLGYKDQLELVADLKRLLHDPETATAARELLEQSLKRRDLLAAVAEEIDQVLRSTPAHVRVRIDPPWNLRIPIRIGLFAIGLLIIVLITWRLFNGPNHVTYTPLEGLPKGKGMMTLTAALSSGGPQVEQPNWQVYEVTADALGNRKEVASAAHATEPQFTLPAASYRVSVQTGAASITRDIDIKAGMVTKSQLLLNAGIIRLTAALSSGGPQVEQPDWQIYEVTADALGNRKKVDSAVHATEPQFTLPAASYRVSVQSGAASITRDIDIKAGMVTKSQLLLNAGIIRLTAALSSDGPQVEQPDWQVYEVTADALGNRKKVDSAAHATEPQFTLPAASYRVSVQSGAASAARDIAVHAGKITKEKFVLAK